MGKPTTTQYRDVCYAFRDACRGICPYGREAEQHCKTETERLAAEAAYTGMKAKVHNKNTGKYYVVTSAAECRDDTDRSAYESACDLMAVITMGEVIVEPVLTKTRS